jgi:hypothetical protein
VTSLLPCPFCGAVAGAPLSGGWTGETLYVTKGDRPRAVCLVKCNECGARGPISVTDHVYKSKPTGAEALEAFTAEANRAEEEAILLWNAAPRTRVAIATSAPDPVPSGPYDPEALAKLPKCTNGPECLVCEGRGWWQTLLGPATCPALLADGHPRI